MKMTVRGLSLNGIVENDTELEVEEVLPERNDLVIYNDGRGQSIKRCVGLPGDTINVLIDHIFINNIGLFSTDFKPLLLTNSAQINCWDDWLKFLNGKISPECYFAVGNVNDCVDSRQRGFILEEQIIGRVKR
jgi:signal peptidase I